MRKTMWSVLLLMVIAILGGCGDKEEATKKEEVKVTAKEAKGNKESKEQPTKNKSIVKTPKLEIIETVNVFGGGTFDLNKDIRDSGAIYITEFQDNIFMTIRQNGNGKYRVISGNKDKWQSISDNSFSYRDNQYPRGLYFFQEQNDEISSGYFTYEDMNFTGESQAKVPNGDSFILANTSMGEGFIVGNEDSYTLYVNDQLADAKPVLEFKDVKEVMNRVPTQTQFPHESKVYVDVELKKMYFEEQSNIYQLDLKSGEPLFENGDMKKIVTNGSVDIIGDSAGNLYVVQTGDKVTVSVYNQNLDALTDELEVPVQNPEDVAVTLTADELHIWNVHTYELEPVLELVRLTKQSETNIDSATEDSTDSEDSNTDDKKTVVIGVLEAAKKQDKESFRSYLISEFGEEGKSFIERSFYDGGVPNFDILDVAKSNEPPSLNEKIQAEKVEVYDVTINITEGEQQGRSVLSVLLYKQADGWKVLQIRGK